MRGQAVQTLRGQISVRHGLIISPDGHLLACCGLARAVRVGELQER